MECNNRADTRRCVRNLCSGGIHLINSVQDSHDRDLLATEQLAEQHAAEYNNLAFPISEFGLCSCGCLVYPCESALSSSASQSTKRQ